MKLLHCNIAIRKNGIQTYMEKFNARFVEMLQRSVLKYPRLKKVEKVDAR